MSSPAVGRPTPLRDAPEKLTGRARYAADLALPGMLRLRLVLSPYAHARIRAVNRRTALAHPGVVAVLTADDLPTLEALPASRSQAMLAKGRVVFQGQPVAVVAATSEAAAQDGAALVAVDYEPLPPLLDPREAMRPDAPPVWPGRAAAHDSHAGAHGGDAAHDAPAGRPASANAGATVRYRRGDVDRAFRESDVVLEREYRSPMVHQAYLEPHATVAAADPLTGDLTIWTGTQGQFFVRAEVARALRIPERRVRVVPAAVGGAFGGKFALFEPLVAAAALHLRRAVSLVVTRMEEFQAATPAPPGIFSIKMGARRDGTLTALRAEILFDSGAFGGSPVVLAALATGAPYRIPHLDIQAAEALTNKAPAGSYRAPGATPVVFAVESHMDDLARALALDPIEFRLRNLIDGDPMHDGSPWPPLALRACLETLRDHPVWRSRGREPGRGCGIALTPWRGGLEPAAAVCRLDEDGTLNVMVGSIDITGSHTSLALIAADLFGVPPEMIRIQESDTAQAPYAGLSAGSKTTYTVGLAVRQAVADARAQLLAIAAEVMEANAGDLDVAGGWVAVRGVPDRRMFIGDLARLTMQYSGRYAPVYGRGVAAPSRRAAAAAAHLAEVRVDGDTGAVTVERYVAVHDVGRAVNPPAVRGQIQGGVAQGIGWALLEQMVYDEQGTLVTASFADYALPSFRTVPPIDVRLIETPLDFTPFGARVVGEPPVVPVAAAIANAVCDAVGARVSALPITPAAVLAARLRRADVTTPVS
ncbi:MAG: xanthine dehydrogenase family protein molybdopterin-binding subunit [bacterium]